MIRIYIADDHKLLTEGLANLLKNTDDMVVVGTGRNGHDVLQFLSEHKVDVVLMDINMPQMNGIEATKSISAQFPDTKILALSMYNKSSFIQQMLKNGALGYILKNTGQEDLVNAVRTVANGERYVGPAVSRTLMESMFQQKTEVNSFIPELTRREKDVLGLIAREHTTQEISDQLNISLNTVETHRKNLLSKFGVRNSVGLVKAAMERGLLE